MGERKRSDRYDSDDGYDSKRSRRSVYIVKLLCPYYNAGAIIGKGGDRIKDVKDKSGCAIEISRHEARFPGTEERVITIEGTEKELQEACRLLNERIRDDDPPSSSRSFDDDNEKRRKTSRILVCDSSMAMIIGRGGNNIRDLKRDHCVQINTSKRHETPRSLDERIISIEGEDRDVDRCMDEIISQICTDERARMRFNVDYSEYYNRSRGRNTDRYSRRDYERRSRSRERYKRSYSRERRSYSKERRGGRYEERRSASRSRTRSRS